MTTNLYCHLVVYFIDKTPRRKINLWGTEKYNKRYPSGFWTQKPNSFGEYGILLPELLPKLLLKQIRNPIDLESKTVLHTSQDKYQDQESELNFIPYFFVFMVWEDILFLSRSQNTNTIFIGKIHFDWFYRKQWENSLAKGLPMNVWE